MEMTPLGDGAVTLSPAGKAWGGRWEGAASLAGALRGCAPRGVREVTVAFGAITVSYEAAEMALGVRPLELIGAWVRGVVATGAAECGEALSRVVELPVRYGGEAGPDLREVAGVMGVSEGELVEMHWRREYTVAAVGFLPGFAYLTGLPQRVRVPRRATPRVRVPAGSVAIGGPYTGVYPVSSPGGWQVIGRTEVRLFDAGDLEVEPLRVGDRVRFVPEGRFAPAGRPVPAGRAVPAGRKRGSKGGG